MQHIYAKIETNFFHDARFRSMTEGERLAYLAVWLLAVETSTDVLPAIASTSTYIGHRANVHPRSVQSMVKKGSSFPQPLVKRNQDGTLTVCGVRKFHPKLINHGSHREEKRREEEDEPEKTLSATPFQSEIQEATDLWQRYYGPPEKNITTALGIMVSQGGIERVRFAISESIKKPRATPIAYTRKVFNDTHLKTPP
jgi:hypothetical protein